MYRWCAYCWKLLGERPPYADYGVTHGICPSCLARDATSEADAIARLRPLREVFRALDDLARRTDAASLDAALSEARALGVAPIDLLFGVLAPALYRVGRAWEEGWLSPAAEARFTGYCDVALGAMCRDQVERAPPVSGSSILLTNAPGNRHTLGVRVVAFALRERGHDARAITEAPSLEELERLLETSRPGAVGVSVALAEQLPSLGRVVERIGRVDPTIRVLVGGFAVRAGAPVHVEGAEVFVTVDDLLTVL